MNWNRFALDYHHQKAIWQKIIEQAQRREADERATATKHRSDLQTAVEGLKDQEQKLREKEEEVKNLQQKIHLLIAEKKAITDEAQELRAKASQIEKLQEKSRTFREHLNSTIAEQQMLHKNTEKTLRKAVEEVRKEGLERKFQLEMALKDCEMAMKKLEESHRQRVEGIEQDSRNGKFGSVSGYHLLILWCSSAGTKQRAKTKTGGSRTPASGREEENWGLGE